MADDVGASIVCIEPLEVEPILRVDGERGQDRMGSRQPEAIGVG